MATSIKNLIAAIMIAVSSYLAWAEILPAHFASSELKTLVTEKSDLLSSRLEVVQNIENLKQENVSKYAALQRLALVVPEKKDISEIISAMETIFSRSGLMLENLPLNVFNDEKEKLQKIGFNTSVIGTYDQLLSFLDYLERNIRLYNIGGIHIQTSSADQPDNKADPPLELSVEGNFYWLNQRVSRPQTEEIKSESGE